MVNPLLFDLSFQLNSTAFDVVEIYGSSDNTPREDFSSVMHVSSLFPSTTTSTEGTKGGLILLKLRRKLNASGDSSKGIKRKHHSLAEQVEGGGEPPKDTLRTLACEDLNTILFTITYLERSGVQKVVNHLGTLEPSAANAASPADKSARKGVLLTRYVQLVREWIGSVLSRDQPSASSRTPASLSFQPAASVHFSPPLSTALVSQATLTIGSSPVALPIAPCGSWKAKFESFVSHFKREMEYVGDDSLIKEMDVLAILASQEDQFRHASTESYGDLLAQWQYEVSPPLPLLSLSLSLCNH